INYIDTDGHGKTLAFFVGAGCGAYAGIMGWLGRRESAELDNEISQLRRLLVMAEKEIERKDACGEDSFPLLAHRQQLDSEIHRRAKEKAKLTTGSDLGKRAIICGVLAGIAKILPEE